MDSAERWPTPELIQAAVDRFKLQLPGWCAPAAFGVAFIAAQAGAAHAVSFPVVNVGIHRLPALVLGVITGRKYGTMTFELTPDELRRAVSLLNPAEAATMYQHPNLLAWRSILQTIDAGAKGQIVAVFIESLDDPVSSPYDAAWRAQIARGDRSTLYT